MSDEKFYIGLEFSDEQPFYAEASDWANENNAHIEKINDEVYKLVENKEEEKSVLEKIQNLEFEQSKRLMREVLLGNPESIEKLRQIESGIIALREELEG